MTFRPKYETFEDLSKETIAIKKFISSFGEPVDFAKLPIQGTAGGVK